jgi:hypothetical protein
MNHRKCWYLQQQPQSTESSTAGSNTAVQGSPSFGSFLLSLLPGRPSAVSNVPQQNAATVGTPSVPGTEPVAAKKSAPSSERRWVLRAKRSERPAQADQIKLRGEQKYLDSAQRDALFQEFLRWAAWHDQTQSFDGQ